MACFYLTEAATVAQIRAKIGHLTRALKESNRDYAHLSADRAYREELRAYLRERLRRQ